MLVGEIDELDSCSETLVFGRFGVSYFPPKVQGDDDALPGRVLWRSVQELKPGTGRGHVDDPAVAPALGGISLDHVPGPPIREMPGQEPP